MGKIQDVINEYRQLLANREASAERAISDAYTVTLNYVMAQLDVLFQQIQERLDRGEDIPLSWLYESNRLIVLEQLIRYQIDAYGSLVLSQLIDSQRELYLLGIQAGQDQLTATLATGVTWRFLVPPTDAMAGVVGATRRGSPLERLFTGFGAEAAKSAREALILGVSLGIGPRELAKKIQDALGVSRNKALTISRTESLRAFRSGNMATFRENEAVLKGWRWTCAKSRRTCMACLAMDGTEHPLSEDMANHPCCRCAPVPITRSWSEILGDPTIPDTTPSIQTGLDWFEKQKATTQQKMMGPAKYNAWQENKFELKDMVGVHHSKEWGDSVYEKPLKELV